MEGKWLLAFWRACRALNDPAGRAIAKLDEWTLVKLVSQARGRKMSARDWLHYLMGALAVLGVDASVDEAYREDEDRDGYFVLEDGNIQRRLVMWTPAIETLSIGIYWPKMTRHIFAILKGNGEVSFHHGGVNRDLIDELLVLVHAVAGEEWRTRVLEAMGGRDA
jgi:hypothetical protein